MTMHRGDVSLRVDVPAHGRPHPTPTISRPTVADPASSEWSAGLDLAATLTSGMDSATSLASAGFVDFDAIETIRVSSEVASRQ